VTRTLLVHLVCAQGASPCVAPAAANVRACNVLADPGSTGN